MIVEGVTKVADSMSERFLGTVPIAPDQFKEFFASDELVWPFGKTQEYVDGFRRQVPLASRTGYLALEWLDTPATEPEPLQQLRIQGVTSPCL